MDDRLEEIKARKEWLRPGGVNGTDVLWLIAEVEQLRLNNKKRRAERIRIWDKLVKALGYKATDPHQLSDMLDFLIRDYHQRGEQITQLNKELTGPCEDTAPSLSGKDRLGEILENVSAKVYDRKARQDITWLSTAIGELRREIKTLARAMGMVADQTPQTIVMRAVRIIQSQATELAEIHDLLAEALGYHKDAEDDPNSPCPGDYVTGDHTSVTLAMEAATVLENLRTNGIAANQITELRRELAARQRQCSCAYWADSDRLMPTPNCPTHGVEAHDKKMQGERAIQELQTLRRILLGETDG